jgi:hypothetical protein
MTPRMAVVVGMLGMLGASCAKAPEESDQDPTVTVSAHLYEGPGVIPWPGGQVPVCFSTAAGLQLPAQEQQWIKQILSQPTDPVRDSWSAVATIDFTFQNGCPVSGASSWVEIQARNNLDAWSGSLMSNGGYGGFTNRLGWGGSGFSTVVQIDYCTSADCTGASLADYMEEVRFTAIHEFGHVLGFEHEQSRPDYTTVDCEWDNFNQNGTTVDGGTYLSFRDPDSVMNYCRRSIIHPGPNNDEYIGYEVGYHGADTISAGDTFGVQALYPPKRFPYWFTPAAQFPLL